uniref:ANK_REP_REGION domain-containing protein n=1 Tax=Syphacia muris TaxID=451379 RepID=A0A158R5E8_9BILA
MNEHLQLLRTEYLRLQKEHAELKKEYDVLLASQTKNPKLSGSSLTFVQKLMALVSQLFDKDLYSDLTICCDGQQMRAHKFVIAARTTYWNDLSEISRIELDDIPYNVGYIIIKWMYTDLLEGHLGDSLLIDVLSASNKYKLVDLQQRCEMTLISRLDISNCVSLYQISDSKNLEQLKEACNQLFSIRWNDFTPDLFSGLAAPLLYRILKSHCEFLLHSIVRIQRTDVLFLYFVDNSTEAEELCNHYDDKGLLPLDIALNLNDFDMASALLEHGADINALDKSGRSFLAKAVESGEARLCQFIVEKGGDYGFVQRNTGESLLHILAKSNCSTEMIEWFADRMLHFNVNSIDRDSSTALLTAVVANNKKVVDFLLDNSTTNPNLSSSMGHTPLSIALFDKKNLSLANALVNHGADVNAKCGGVYLLHRALNTTNLQALQFLCRRNADLNVSDEKGMFALHIAANLPVFNKDLFLLLLKSNVNLSLKSKQDGSTIFHYAIQCKYGEKVLKIIFENRNDVGISLSLKDGNGLTSFAKAVLSRNFGCAKILIEAGADINEEVGGKALLMEALLSGNDEAAVFLLENNANASIRDFEGKSCLHIAVELGLLSAVKSLCKKGADLNAKCPVSGMPPLWTALETNAYEVACVLLEHGCDLEVLIKNEEECCEETMLFRSIIMHLSDVAMFLINGGCNVNTIRKYSKGHADDLRTPLHACLEVGLEEVAIALVAHGAKTDVQDINGRTVAHVAVQKKYDKLLKLILKSSDVSSLLLRDRYGASPLVVAMQERNSSAAEAIAIAAPCTVMQFNGAGESLLHAMVKSADLESVLFLLTLNFDVNVTTQNASRVTALHMCAESGNGIVMRNLILAGADVNAVSARGFTPLHIAAYHNHPELCSILLENRASAKILDGNGNNALHAATLKGSVDAVKILLNNSDVDLRAYNKRRQTPLILIARDLSSQTSLEVLKAFLSVDPSYPVDAPDDNGNTLFLLAYMKGNVGLCKSLLHHDICFAVTNSFGVSVFNFETPTKQLLFTLLDSLEKEPKWADGDLCSECNARFSLTIRKHHCRHCGRLVCAKCSEQTIPILKYDLQKAVRVCQICSDVLTIGIKR